MNILIIPARGGSKRIHKKNIREFCGKPIIYWPLKIAKDSKLFDKVIVSTDDYEIAEIAEDLGAEVPFLRPERLSDDYCGINPVLSYTISNMEKQSYRINNVCCIYPTSVFLEKNDLINGFEILQSGDWSYVFSATKFTYPIFRSFKKKSNGGVQMFFPKYYEKRSQDIPIAYHDAAQFYWANSETWKKEERIFSENSFPLILPNWRVKDIDDEDDFKSAELLFKILN